MMGFIPSEHVRSIMVEHRLSNRSLKPHLEKPRGSGPIRSNTSVQAAASRTSPSRIAAPFPLLQSAPPTPTGRATQDRSERVDVITPNITGRPPRSGSGAVVHWRPSCGIRARWILGEGLGFTQLPCLLSC